MTIAGMKNFGSCYSATIFALIRMFSLDVPMKMARLNQWCADINQAQTAVRYDFVFVDEDSFNKYQRQSFAALRQSFREYKS